MVSIKYNRGRFIMLDYLRFLFSDHPVIMLWIIMSIVLAITIYLDGGI